MKHTRALLLTIAVLAFLAVQPVLAWSNGGYSSDPANPDYGTHDWIAQHALDYLPQQEKQYILDNLSVYLYGTELPDNNQAADKIGDTTKHHIYFYANQTLQDDAAGQRASQEYQKALDALKNQKYAVAAKEAGIMTHYIADMAVFGHLMGAKTAWGAEVHHSDYETYVNRRTETYESSFTSYLQYDGSLSSLSAYDGAETLAFDTTFGGASNYSCVWMDANYDWSNTLFSDRCRESLNLAVNAVADVLHTLYVEAQPVPTATASPPPTVTPTATATNQAEASIGPEVPIAITASAATVVAATALIYKKRRQKK
ncbi:MAG: zinc dependent phospholipase C family protein [Candidatus Bathyarchaeota archaeon]|nr:zinc dependent phospholipase C family protein [Candidatus Bathyarchaeota archaeon]